MKTVLEDLQQTKIDAASKRRVEKRYFLFLTVISNIYAVNFLGLSSKLIRIMDSKYKKDLIKQQHPIVYNREILEEMDKFQKVYKMTLKADVKVGILTNLAYLETGLPWSGINFWKMTKKQVSEKSGNFNSVREIYLKESQGKVRKIQNFPKQLLVNGFLEILFFHKLQAILEKECF